MIYMKVTITDLKLQKDFFKNLTGEFEAKVFLDNAGKPMKVIDKIDTNPLGISQEMRDELLHVMNKLENHVQENWRKLNGYKEDKKLEQVGITDKYKDALEKLNKEIEKVELQRRGLKPQAEEYQQYLSKQIDLEKEKLKLHQDHARKLQDELTTKKVNADDQEEKGIVGYLHGEKVFEMKNGKFIIYKDEVNNQEDKDTSVDAMNNFYDFLYLVGKKLGINFEDASKIVDSGFKTIKEEILEEVGKSKFDVNITVNGDSVNADKVIKEITNKLFNAKQNEQIIKSLKGEMQIPPNKIKG